MGPSLKRQATHLETSEKVLLDKKNLFNDVRPFWTTVGARTQNSRLPNAPVLSIHHRFDRTGISCPCSLVTARSSRSIDSVERDGNKGKLRALSTPGPAKYPLLDGKREAGQRDRCTARGVTISPKYREKRSSFSGPGPAMVERKLLDRGVSGTHRAER